ncbi:MFS transporter [Bacillus sp. DNRA2]|uniref:MFS transporter n=1 Tax=Bacillus sp. DNRA2 TaxID=2723053 RepID=UPI00145DAD94|nr:MFS transporter [Bacillus sp. DNRA2]NMD71627.1 MFS transporter [Bacillus sp. DNRA2]
MDVIPYTIYKGKGRIEGRNLFLYATSKTVSLFGSALFNFAIGLYVLKLTASPLSFAITLMLGVVPMILIFPFAGVIADKVNKKKLVVTMDFLSGLLLLIVYLGSGWFRLNVIIIYIATFLLTVFTTFFAVGLEAAKPNVVSEHRLMSINSISKSIDSLAMILGPMLGGVAYGVLDIKLFIVFNSVSFFVSGLLILLMDFSFNKTESGLKVKIKVFEDMKDGFRYLAQRKSMMRLFVLLIAINFFTGYAITVPLPYIVVEVFELTAKDLGIIQGSMPIGMLAGALLVKRIMAWFAYQKMLREISNGLALCMVLLGVPLILEALQFSNIVLILYYCCIMFFIGFSVALIDIPMAYTMQTEIPDEYRGRVLSIGISIAKVMLPLAVLLSGFLLKCLPAYIMPISGGMLFFLVNLRTFVKNKI